MQITTVKCSCDNCEEEMSQLDYEQAVRVTIKIDLPDPNGKCGECSGTVMKICSKCSELIGIVNSKEYHDYVYSQSKLTATVELCKQKILKLFYQKKVEE